MEIEIQIDEKTRLVVRGQYIPGKGTWLEKRDDKTYIRPNVDKVIIESIISNNPDIMPLLKRNVSFKYLEQKILNIINDKK